MPKSKNSWNEATRVQMPAMVHLTKIGYNYIGKITEDMAGKVYDPDTNILIQEFKKKFAELNPEKAEEAESVLTDIRQELDNDDIGESFYKRLKAVSPLKLIDFDNPSANSYCFTAEFTCKRDEDEFRPDITLFVNGLPLVFIEVKKPNNTGGVVAEAERMNKIRFPNRKFRRFINITQLMIFSNNMDYDTAGGIVPIQGAFYTTASRTTSKFNCFREENPLNRKNAPFHENYPYRDIDGEVEKRILSDFNNQVIHSSPEYQKNLNPFTPTNRILTSMCSPERLLFLLKYGITYYHKTKELKDGTLERVNQKHIMRYQQMFAALKVREKISKGVKSGIIWHTQGSGKTALSYYLSYVLTDYFSSVNRVAKYYFIVDRLDLLKQAKEEFEARGLVVKTANSREELMKQFRTNRSQEGNTGEPEITVVNIQRFEENKDKVVLPSYATNLQRVFIIDEAHRGYKPEGSFLANLLDADPDSIKIALTGTPLLKSERESWRVFGDYIHTYYYDKSVQDGYTLKIIREDIETSYREKLEEIYQTLEKDQSLDRLVQKKDIKKEFIIEHENYVKELLRYIINDLKQFRILHDDNSLGGMIICETSEQARKLFAFFDEIQSELNRNSSNPSQLKAGLILYDSDDKETREGVITDFKDNSKIDVLIVFNMLLTGFDAPRLKRLYFGRKLKDHNLLQAITRVNRPYGDNRYGYVIDFADIKKNFKETNEAYLAELNKFNDPDEVGEGNEVNLLGQIIEDPAELIERVQTATQTLFNYPLDNAEEFSSEISNIEDKDELLKIKKALTEIRDCYYIVKSFGDDELKAKFTRFEISKIKGLLSEVQRHVDLVNQREAIENNDENRILVIKALQNITFSFSKIGQEELRLIDDGSELNDKVRKTIRMFSASMDQDDPELITLRDAFLQRLKEHGMKMLDMDEYNEHLRFFDEILKKLAEIERKNQALLRHYNGDAKYVRVHKRIREENINREREQGNIIISKYDAEIVNVLKSIKDAVDLMVFDRNDILRNDAYFEKAVLNEVTNKIHNPKLNKSPRSDRLFIVNRISKQYLEQYNEAYTTV